jgi:hypothetical protein
MNKDSIKPIAPNVAEILEPLASNVHNQWMKGRLEASWKYGPKRDDEKKEHPSIVPYEELSEEEKEYDRQTVMTTINGLLENGFEIQKKNQ